MRKWQRTLDYRLIKEVWAFRANRTPCASPMNRTTFGRAVNQLNRVHAPCLGDFPQHGSERREAGAPAKNSCGRLMLLRQLTVTDAVMPLAGSSLIARVKGFLDSVEHRFLRS